MVRTDLPLVAFDGSRQMCSADFILAEDWKETVDHGLQVLNQPEKMNGGKALLEFAPQRIDSPDLAIWEGSVHYDVEREMFQLWYMPCTYAWKPCFLAYAESTDGLAWNRSMNLGIVNVNGSRANNFVLAAEWGELMPVVVVDPPEREANATRRYKLMYRTASSCLGVGFSPNGIVWHLATEIGCVIHNANSPTAVLWHPGRKQYLAHTRDVQAVPGTQRRVLLSASDDFIHWSPEGDVQFDELDPPMNREFYDLPFTVVPEAGGLMVGCLNVFHVIEADYVGGGKMPPAPRPQWYERLSYQLVSSRNGSSFSRAGYRQVFLPNGPPGSPDAGILWMYQPPVYVNDSIYFFYSGLEGTHWAPVRKEFQGGVVMGAKLRRDGWVRCFLHLSRLPSRY